jgi:hypothetical protein
MIFERTITIPAGGMWSESIPTSTVFACVSATADFTVKPNGGGLRSCRGGRGFGEPNGKPFHMLLFQGVVGTVITFQLGDEQITLDPAASSTPVSNLTKDAPSYTKGADVTQLNTGAGGVLTYSGSDAGNRRRSITIQNLDGTNFIQVYDGSNKKFCMIPPGQAWTFFSSGVFKLRQDSGAAISCEVGEVFYS